MERHDQHNTETRARSRTDERNVMTETGKHGCDNSSDKKNDKSDSKSSKDAAKKVSK